MITSTAQSNIIPRPRIEAILDTAARGKLVYVIAGAGYGKTQAVRSYIEKQHDAVVRWIQLTESDNIGSRYWENLTHSVAHDNPELAERLREFGFPQTGARFKKFAEIIKATEHRSLKTFLVLDDFHLIHSKQALRFAERCAHLNIPGACVVIISRTEPEINTVALFNKNRASIITEDELRFDESEIKSYFKMRNIPLSAGVLPQLSHSTGGWALAVSLLSMVLERNPKNIDIAIDTMKQNVFKLMETEAFNDFPEDMKKTMVKLSLISDLPLKMMWEHFDESAALRKAPQLAMFIWFDSFTGQDRIHPLYWDFLLSRQNILTDDEKHDTYKRAADWCCNNGFYTDGMKYLAAARQFEDMLKVLLTYPMKMPHDMCHYFLELIENIKPSQAEKNDKGYVFLVNLFVPLLLLGEGKIEEAQSKSLSNIKYWRRMTNSPFTPLMLSIAYSNLTYIDMYACTVSHEYNAPEYLKKSLEYQSKSKLPPLEIAGAFTVADIRSFACPIGQGAKAEEFDIFRETSNETCRLVADTPYNIYYGYDDLVACELSYYKNNPDTAKLHANQAIMKAREKNQHSIEAMAAMYLFRVAMLQGDYLLIKELFRQRYNSPQSPYFWNKQFLYELGVSFIYAQIGKSSAVPLWLSGDETDTTFESPVPVRELICGARYYIASKKYTHALTLLSGAYPREEHERFAFGELELTLLTAAARAGTGDMPGAVRDFENAYLLSYDGLFEMPFIELGRDFAPIADAASDAQSSVIPQQWLKLTGRKVSAYIKKSTVVLNAFKREQKLDDSVKLSNREYDVLIDLYHGLSREEIAINRYLSVNTVHKIVQSVFLKLNAGNKADAIRIAVKKKIINEL